MIKIITKKEYNKLLDYEEKYKHLSGESFTFYTSTRSKRAGLLQLSKEELVKIIFDINNECIQLFEKNNNYIKQLQQENAQLKQQLKDKDEKISKVVEIIRNDTTLNPQRQRDRLTNILESNKED